MPQHQTLLIIEGDILLGILTDGDIRRLLIKNTNIQIITREHINTIYVYETDIEKYLNQLSNKFIYIPILVENKIIGIFRN